MKRQSSTLPLLMVAFLIAFGDANAQEHSANSASLPIQYEELTSPEFVTAVERAHGVCMLPFGILEKHGPHLPLGTDLLSAREVAVRAAKKEYAVVYPQYYFGQIFEAKHQPGTIAYSADVIWKLLQETCDELGRNGFTKIVLVNGHGGNRYFLNYFCQAQLASRKPYAVILFTPAADSVQRRQATALRKTPGGGHADEDETSVILALRPDLAHVDRGSDQSGENLNRLASIPFAFTGIWWYARYPNHYAGDGSVANRELGELLLDGESEQLVQLLKAIKEDTGIETLQEEFYEKLERR